MTHNYRSKYDDISKGSAKSVPGKMFVKSSSFPTNNSYVMEHLATFSVNTSAGIAHPLDGMRRLLEMEKNTGIWSQKMNLRLESNCIIITDYETGDLIESFPVSLIQSPTAFTTENVLELYNNVLVFSVSDAFSDQSEMHIFQSQCISALNLVQDIKALQSNELVVGQTASAITSQVHSNEQYPSRDESHLQQRKAHYRQYVEIADAMHFGELLHDISENEFRDLEEPTFSEDIYSEFSEKYEREVNLLNNCFDDIEKFIARLQHTAAAAREVERRRYIRREAGDGLINLHTRPPMQKDFVDILAKFKLSFNLLSKLKTHIHDPNAPELVHFLFTPLALIVEAAKESYGASQIPTKVIDPLLTRETINFLMNCVSSKETELWKSLGASWTTAKEQWQEKRGSTPSGIVDEVFHDNIIKKNETPRERSVLQEYQGNGRQTDRQEDESQKNTIGISINYMRELESNEDIDRVCNNEVQSTFINISDNSIGLLKMGSFNKSEDRIREMGTTVGNWISELHMKRSNAVIVCYPRTANNDKELSVVKGEYLEILDDSRKWWKARNVHGQIAHIPSTIVAPVNFTGNTTIDMYEYGV